MNKKRHYFLLPEGLKNKIQTALEQKDIIKITKKGTLNQDSINLLHKYLFIVDYIVRYRQSKQDKYNEEGIQINSSNLTDYIFGVKSSVTKSIIDFLLENSFIIMTSSQIFNGKGATENKCRSFQLHPSWECSRIEQYQCPDSVFIRKLAQGDCFTKKSKKTKNVKQMISPVIEDVISYQERLFKINTTVSPKVYEYFFKKYGYTQQQLKTPGIAVDSTDLSLLTIINKEVIVSRPDQNSRVYSPLTSLKRTLRRYLLLNGQKLIGLDIKNCQLLISVVIIKKYIELNPEQYRISSDFNLYMSYAEQGVLYEVLAEAMGLLELLRQDRAAFKEKLFKDFFFSKNKKYLCKLQKAFKGLFPTVFEVITAIKNDNKYSEWAVLLQQVESILIIDGAVKKLQEKNIAVLTLHDGLYFSNYDDLELGKQFLETEFQGHELNVNFKIEHPENDLPDIPLTIEKSETLKWFEIKIGRELVTYWFKIGTTHFNIRKSTYRKYGQQKRRVKKETLYKHYIAAINNAILPIF